MTKILIYFSCIILGINTYIPTEISSSSSNGVFRTKIPLGNKENNRCRNGLKTSLWQYYYPNSNAVVFLEGHYKKGARVGVWKVFLRDGTLFKKGKYLTISLPYTF